MTLDRFDQRDCDNGEQARTKLLPPYISVTIIASIASTDE
jgi:hypothetical protein